MQGFMIQCNVTTTKSNFTHTFLNKSLPPYLYVSTVSRACQTSQPPKSLGLRRCCSTHGDRQRLSNFIQLLQLSSCKTDLSCHKIMFIGLHCQDIIKKNINLTNSYCFYSTVVDNGVTFHVHKSKKQVILIETFMQC